MTSPRTERPEQLATSTLARASRRDPAACRELVERYQRPVFAVLSRLLAPVGRQALVEDLAQECFLRVFRSLHRFDPAGSATLSTWILTIAARLAIDELRRPVATALVPLDQAGLVSPQSVESSAEHRQQLEQVFEALDDITPEYRAALVLRLFHEMSYDQIAAALGIELGTVKSRLARARTALTLALRGER
ncbi:MAG: sigma-70 family RNA polymerase sigma factor [Pseudomonadota bacterium]